MGDFGVLRAGGCGAGIEGLGMKGWGFWPRMLGKDWD